jgi:hypothetical protein
VVDATNLDIRTLEAVAVRKTGETDLITLVKESGCHGSLCYYIPFTKHETMRLFIETPRTSKRKQSEAQKSATKRQKAAGSIVLRQKQRNPDTRSCPTCVMYNVYEAQQPHHSKASPRCPYHNISFDELRSLHFGGPYTFATRKVSLNKLLKLSGSNKSKFIDNTRRLTDWIRVVGIKVQMFINYYFLRQLEYDDSQAPGTGQEAAPSGHQDNVVNQDFRGVTPVMFSSGFAYSCIQLIIGAKITNTAKNFPAKVMTEIFHEYGDLLGNNHDIYMVKSLSPVRCSSCLNSLSVTIATSMKNAIVETFEARCIRYMEHCLRQEKVILKKRYRPYEVRGTHPDYMNSGSRTGKQPYQEARPKLVRPTFWGYHTILAYKCREV